MGSHVKTKKTVTTQASSFGLMRKKGKPVGMLCPSSLGRTKK